MTRYSITDDKVLASRLRRIANRRGLTLSLSRTRDAQALDYGKVTITGPDGAQLAVVDGWEGAAAFLGVETP